jgi:hypothetical protein
MSEHHHEPAKAEATEKVENVVRGPRSIDFFGAVVFGFAIQIEGTIIQMLPPSFVFPCNLITFALLGFITYRLLFIKRVQDKLIEWRVSFERNINRPS